MKKCRVVQEKPAENVHLKRDFVGKHGGENSRLFSSHWNLCERRRVGSILVCSILIDVLLFVVVQGRDKNAQAPQSGNIPLKVKHRHSKPWSYLFNTVLTSFHHFKKAEKGLEADLLLLAHGEILDLPITGLGPRPLTRFVLGRLAKDQYAATSRAPERCRITTLKKTLFPIS